MMGVEREALSGSERVISGNPRYNMKPLASFSIELARTCIDDIYGFTEGLIDAFVNSKLTCEGSGPGAVIIIPYASFRPYNSANYQSYCQSPTIR
jgi:hypothetical protein